MDGPSRRPTDSSRSEGTPNLSEGPSGGAKTFWLLLGRLPKVTRCKSGTLSRHYRSNGYTPNRPKEPQAIHTPAQTVFHYNPPHSSLGASWTSNWHAPSSKSPAAAAWPPPPRNCTSPRPPSPHAWKTSKASSAARCSSATAPAP